MGCAWLIRRYIDPAAEFLFVPPGKQPLPDDAEPFDVPGTRLSHRGGHSSFYTVVRGTAWTTRSFSGSPKRSTRPTSPRKSWSSRRHQAWT
jgi:hypothetical protein